MMLGSRHNGHQFIWSQVVTPRSAPIDLRWIVMRSVWMLIDDPKLVFNADGDEGVANSVTIETEMR
jgi:hypothetical protein